MVGGVPRGGGTRQVDKMTIKTRGDRELCARPKVKKSAEVVRK